MHVGVAVVACSGDDDIRAPLAATTGRLFGNSGDPPSPHSSRARREYRTPVTAFQDSGSSSGLSGDAANLPDLFRPPTHILADMPFEQARLLAKSQHRVLCCNLQVATEFASHVLNRDVWHSDSVSSFVQQALVLYQQFTNTGEGMELCKRYAVPATTPAILFIDARTGECVQRLPVVGLTAQGFLAAAVAVVAASAPVLPSLPSDAASSGPAVFKRGREASPAAASAAATSALSSSGSFETDEDRQLKRAIAESLLDSEDVVLDGDADESDVQYVYDDDDDNDNDDGAVTGASASLHAADSASPGCREPDWIVGIPDPRTFVPTSLPAEPGTGEAGSMRLRLSLPSGKRIVIAVRESDTVSLLYTIVAHQLDLPHPVAARYEALRRAAIGVLGPADDAVEAVRSALGPLAGASGVESGEVALPAEPEAPARAGLPGESLSRSTRRALERAAFSIVSLRPSRSWVEAADETMGTSELKGCALLVKRQRNE